MNKKRNKDFNNNEAFTLIELIVVMAIIAVLVLLAAPSFLNYTKDAKVTAMEQDTKVLSDAAELYYMKENDWPIGEAIDSPGVGGNDTLYRLDENKIKSSIKNIKGDYKDYGLVIEGIDKGKIFHLNGIEDKDGNKSFGPSVSIDEEWEELSDKVKPAITEAEELLKKYLKQGKELTGASPNEFKNNPDKFFDKEGFSISALSGYKVIPQPKTELEGVFWGNELGSVIYQDGDFGKNLVKNSNFSNGLKGWVKTGKTENDENLAGIAQTINIDGMSAAKVGNNKSTRGIYQVPLKGPGTYSTSFKSCKRGVSESKPRIGFLNLGIEAQIAPVLTQTFDRYEFTKRISQNDLGDFYHKKAFHLYAMGGEFYITDIKVSKDATTTPWTPAPEDLTIN